MLGILGSLFVLFMLCGQEVVAYKEADLATMYEILASQPASGRRFFKKLDLRKAPLEGLDFSNADFFRVNFGNTNLARAKFSKSTFYYVNFDGAVMVDVQAYSATFNTVTMRANLTGSILDRSFFQDVECNSTCTLMDNVSAKWTTWRHANLTDVSSRQSNFFFSVFATCSMVSMDVTASFLDQVVISASDTHAIDFGAAASRQNLVIR